MSRFWHRYGRVAMDAKNRPKTVSCETHGDNQLAENNLAICLARSGPAAVIICRAVVSAVSDSL